MLALSKGLAYNRRMSDSRFVVIDGGQAQKPKRKRKPGSLRVWECRFCEAETGIRSRYMMKIRQNAFETDRGVMTGGNYVWVCSMCFMRGKLRPCTA
jgi:hypothetical protein